MFLNAIKTGHDPEAAAIGAGLPLSVVSLKSMERDIESALRAGAALLRSKILEIALGQAEGDVPALERALARREALFASSDDNKLIIERVIFSRDPCKKCGEPYEYEDGNGNKFKPQQFPFRQRVRLSDPPRQPEPLVQPDEPAHTATARPRTRSEALLALVNGEGVVEIPSTSR